MPMSVSPDLLEVALSPGFSVSFKFAGRSKSSSLHANLCLGNGTPSMTGPNRRGERSNVPPHCSIFCSSF